MPATMPGDAARLLDAANDAALTAYLGQLPRAVRFFSADLDCLRDNCPDRLARYPIFIDENNQIAKVPQTPADTQGWPVQQARLTGRPAQRWYPLLNEEEPPQQTLVLVRAQWLAQLDPPLIVEEMERIDVPGMTPAGQRVEQFDAELTGMIGKVADLLQRRADPLDFLQLRFENPHLEPCHFLRACLNPDCPMHGEMPGRCWELHYQQEAGEAEVCHDPLTKLKACAACGVFAHATPDPLLRVSENFNRLLSLLQLKYEEAIQAQHELQQADKRALLGELMLGLAHEIKTPLSVITSRLDCLRLEQESLSPEELAVDLRVLQEHAGRMRRVLESLFNLARPLPHKPEWLQARQEIEHVLSLAAKTLKQAGIQTEVCCAAERLTIFADRAQLHQLLLNLILNARDAMPDGGTLTLAASREVGLVPGTALEVRDTGHGIPSQDLKRVFSQFFSTKMDRGGTGLGLSVCQRIMLNHGGRIHADSEPGHGSVFTAWFPLPRAEGA